MKGFVCPKRDDEVSYTTSSPEAELIQAVILRAIYDCCPQRVRRSDSQQSRNRTSQELANSRDAREWLYSDSTEEWSFRWCVEQVVPEHAQACIEAIRLRIPLLQTKFSQSDIPYRNVFVRRL